MGTTLVGTAEFGRIEKQAGFPLQSRVYFHLVSLFRNIDKLQCSVSLQVNHGKQYTKQCLK